MSATVIDPALRCWYCHRPLGVEKADMFAQHIECPHGHRMCDAHRHFRYVPAHEACHDEYEEEGCVVRLRRWRRELRRELGS